MKYPNSKKIGWTSLLIILLQSLAFASPEGGVPNSADNQLDLQVSGMTCQSCSNAIQSSVKKLEHVQSVQADHQSGKVSVTCDTECPAKGQVVSAIEKLGYTVENK